MDLIKTYLPDLKYGLAVGYGVRIMRLGIIKVTQIMPFESKMKILTRISIHAMTIFPTVVMPHALKFAKLAMHGLLTFKAQQSIL